MNQKPTYCPRGAAAVWVGVVGILLGLPPGVRPAAADDASLFTSRVLPILTQRCFACHSHDHTIKGGLAMDSAGGLAAGGVGGPVLVPGAPDESRLIKAIRYADKSLRMPPDKPLPAEEVAALVDWVQQGAHDPRPKSPLQDAPGATDDDKWEALYQERLRWWSLQPVIGPSPPDVQGAGWVRNDIDRFILARLEAEAIGPAPEADRRTLARRLSVVLTGLPPKPGDIERFVGDESPQAYDAYVQTLLDSPHFGERWARHWMDVVHYADTHGYEWDTPAKNAWMFRDYLIRAFNRDVPFNRLILEQLAGDLIEPRIDPQSGVNESLIGPMALRLGERRHGDNADAEGVTQEAVANMIDTVSKGFLATTVACAQCHDHKLDAVAQRDYYSVAGLLMSSRWPVRTVETADPNGEVLEELRAIKHAIRADLAARWRSAEPDVAHRIAAMPVEPPKPGETTSEAETPPFPETLPALWLDLQRAVKPGEAFGLAWQSLADRFHAEHEARRTANAANLQLVADFTRETLPPGWRVDGFGMQHGLVRDGEMVIADEGDAAVAHLLPAGRWTHVWSKRLGGALRSPLLEQTPAPTLSVGYAGGHHAAQSLVVDNAFHSERMKFLNQPDPGWLTFTAGSFPALAGGPDPTPRRVYLELVTKSLNNYFPPRYGYGGVKEQDERDPRSWFGVTRLYRHAPGQGPVDDLARYAPLFDATDAPATAEDAARQIAALVSRSVARWDAGRADEHDVRVINEALAAKWLPNEPLDDPNLAQRVAQYRAAEKRLKPARVIGTADDWHEGRDEPLAIRGSYTDLGESVPRGNIRFLGGPGTRAYRDASGRLEWAHRIASDDNPLTARVFVNRVWHHVFGAGLVRTVDDFGHLGETPSHPELLDWLAQRFMADGWSTKELVRLMVTSATWRQSGAASDTARVADAENRLWHHMPLRRLEAEAIYDALLAVSGRLDPALYGPPLDPYRIAEDPAKRLHTGPLDGDGRRSLYIKMTLMEPPKLLALFNQPIPKLTTGRRDVTNVPNQALALLNDPFVTAMAGHWSERLVDDGAASPEARAHTLFMQAFGRPPSPEEANRLVALAVQCAELRGADPAALLSCRAAWQDAAHAVFNLKEFIYIP